ncbi:hypothetical protein AB0L65_56010 [Nonomuraea sp. NPDC052116]|uniref:hypothetical protein n=1 Tax=Nonomuraea sp. NPDC052116 TaxID=3155665 RepID=UPI00341FAD14
MDNADHQSAASSPADAAPGYTVPQRQDGWPNWLGRRPMRSSDREKIREALETGLPDGPLTVPGPFLRYLTIDGLDRVADQRKLIRLRGRIHAAARVVAEGCHTTYHATDSTLTIGIQAPDAQERINQLRNALSKLITKHGWTTRDEPR